MTPTPIRPGAPRPAGAPSRPDAGIALFAVVSAMALLTLFLTLSLYVVLSNSKPARTSQDSRAAYAAARAGIDEYLARLNATSGNYWTLGNTDPSNPALSASGPGQQVQGGGANAARFRYQVLNSTSIARTGRILLRVTGISGPGQSGTGVTKTLTATLSPTGFGRFVYFSDTEVIDPALMTPSISYVTVNGSTGPSSGYRYAMDNNDMCSLKYYEGRNSSGFTLSGSIPPVGIWNTSTGSWFRAPGFVTSGTVRGISCYEIQWAAGDTVNGSLHSNDALQINGSVTFSEIAESSWPYCRQNPTANCWWGSGSPSSSGYRPRYADPIALPQSNADIKTIAQNNTLGIGCYYTGATRITISGSTMSVLSPNTTSAPSRCLNTSNRANAQTVALPQVIYVDQVSGTCSRVGYPVTGESTTRGVTTDYSCNRGTAFVSGTVDGQVTIATLDDIVVTGDLTYAAGTTSDDVVGLVAGNYVWVYHPIDSNGANLSGYTSIRNVHTIQASILALRHSFLVQNWAYGSALTTSTSTRLNVTGSMAQKYRGPVGTGSSSSISTGYVKNYVWDSRLAFLQPPYFLQPVASPWGVQKLTDG